jgi:methionyl-tRNA formyltransferase
LKSDLYIVFGASFIRGPLCEHLVNRRAVNIHMGISPYYRGSATNFWALYDRRPDLVGATVHLLSKGLDSGPMLFHALPAAQAIDPFVYGMRAVEAAHAALIRHIRRGTLLDLQPIEQDRSKQMRYTRNADFSDGIAEEYLSRLPSAAQLAEAIQSRDLTRFLRPEVVEC